MCTFLSASRWMLLLSLATMVILSVSQGGSANFSPNIGLSCCKKLTDRKVQKIDTCYEQFPRDNCKVHAFVVMNKRYTWCINPTSQWLINKIQKGEIKCPPILSYD